MGRRRRGAWLGLACVLALGGCALWREEPPPPPTPLDRADADMRRLVETWRALGGEPLAGMTPDAARREPTLADAVDAVVAARTPSVVPVSATPASAAAEPEEGRSLEVADGLQARVWVPDGEGRFPVILFFPGGGWVLDPLAGAEGTARALAREARAVVVAVATRRAPEHRFPAAHEDAWEAYRWLRRHTRTVGGKGDRVVVAGEGAGASLAVGIALRARDEGAPEPIYQVLLTPVAGTSAETPSYRASAGAAPLDGATMTWFLQQYVRGPEDLKDPRLDVANNPDLGRLAPATIVTAGIDPLSSGGEALARGLSAAGVGAAFHHYPGATHGFFGTGRVVDAARRAERIVGLELRQAFAVGL